MSQLKALFRHRGGPLLLVGLALATSGLFKVAAFAREAFIAAKFGLSAVTDAYFALQQLPMTFASYMCGAFALAFAPAFAAGRRQGSDVDWLPGLTYLGILAGALCTGLMLATAPLLLRVIHSTGSENALSTLGILSLCFVPVVCIGIWAGICTAGGKNISSMIMTGLPFLVMTLWLIGIYAAGALNDLSLPVSMAAGFGLVGLYALIRIVALQPASFRFAAAPVWKIPAFRAFLRQLGASSLENAGFAANQLLIIYSMSRSGVGIVSANNCAMRIGLLGYTLMSMPMAQLVQAKLCAAADPERPASFRRWLPVVVALTAMVAVALLLFRYPIIRMVYMHGKFHNAELRTVAGLLPAWIAYVAVMSINTVTARYLFIQSRGATYVQRQMIAYSAACLFRLVSAGRLDAACAIWCSVAAEGCALLLNLRSCFSLRAQPEVASVPAAAEAAG